VSALIKEVYTYVSCSSVKTSFHRIAGLFAGQADPNTLSARFPESSSEADSLLVSFDDEIVGLDCSDPVSTRPSHVSGDGEDGMTRVVDPDLGVDLVEAVDGSHEYADSDGAPSV
jgi:hypothetical protein